MSNEKKISRLLISATGSGRGKTTIVTSLLSLLKERDYRVSSFKCGPDYIDPMYHESVLGVSSKNLDPFFCSEDLLRASFIEDANELNVIEGCMGLYDGLGVTSECSSYSVAKALKSPVILVVDGYGMGASIIAEIKGFLSMDTEGLIKGVILNRLSKGYFEKLKPAIEEALEIKVIGYFPKQKGELLKSRHLGLLAPEENNAREEFEVLRDIVAETIDIEALLEVAAGAPKLGASTELKELVKTDLSGSLIAVARDEAFSFYYRDNLKALEMAGARLEFFSPMRDERLPEGTTAIYLGGGYPELYLKELSENTKMREAVKAAALNNMPIVAECGGFMYLCDSIEGESMVGVFPEKVFKTKGLVRFGYVNAHGGNYDLKGHEFHHYDVQNPGGEFLMEKASTKETYRAMHRINRVIAGFPHLYYFSDPAFLEEFK